MELEYDSEIEAYGSVAVLTVSGETDLYTARSFKRDVDEALDLAPGDVVLDLLGLDLVDSTALGVLIAAQSRMLEERRGLVLVVGRRHVLRVFDITGLRDMFSIVPTLAEALRGTGRPDVSTRAA
jgi:anti-sigma B factor antagonist